MSLLSSHKKPEAFDYLLLAYVALLPFVRIVYLPVVYAKIQPTELVFLVLGPLALLRYGSSLWPKDRWLGLAIFFYLLANLVAAAVAADLSAWLEAFGRCYLVLLALIIARYVAEAYKTRSRQLLDVFLYGTALSAVCAYVGYLIALSGHFNEMVQVYGNYPYFGTVWRAKGFTAGGGMLIVVLLLPTIYAWRAWRKGTHSLWWFILLLPLAFLTFSKEVLLLGLGLLLVDKELWRWLSSGKSGRGRWMQWLVTGAAAVVFWGATHYIVQPRQSFEASRLAGTNYTSGRVVWEGETFQLVETSYTALKKAGVSVATQNPWFGVGPGQFGRALPAEQAAGRYPAHLPHYDPHWTWGGAFSETGFFGGLATLFFAFILFGRSWGSSPVIHPSVTIFCLMILILSVSKDVANFRFLWLAIGLVIGADNSRFEFHEQGHRQAKEIIV